MHPEDREIAESVARHGWHAIGVNDVEPPFTYTCGLLATFGHPELILFGLSPRASHSILAAMVDDLRRGESYAAPGEYLGVLEGFPIGVRAVHPAHHAAYLGYALGHCRIAGNPGGLAAMQVFWPDRAGCLPTAAGCDGAIKIRQPRLDEPPAPPEIGGG